MDRPIPVIDLFAGPGGLGEGFSALGRFEGTPRFKIHLSIEKDQTAHQTLELRAFFRQFPHGEAPKEYYQHLQTEGRFSRADLFKAYPYQAQAARDEALKVELGKVDPVVIRQRIRNALGRADKWVLIGGPPCQAYSNAGRSRNKGKKGYVPEDDGRQYLYKEYLQIIADHRPAVFVMENVKGLLSATLNSKRIFDRIREDLTKPAEALRREGRNIAVVRWDNYHVYSLVSQGSSNNGEVTDYVVRAEHYGVPQARHRIILLGVREDISPDHPALLSCHSPIPSSRVLDGLPPLRSGLSKVNDSDDAWLWCLRDALERRWFRGAKNTGGEQVCEVIKGTIASLSLPAGGRGREYVQARVCSKHENSWFVDKNLGGVCNHSTRTHMPSDLHRYLYAACFARAHGYSPRLCDFPRDLLPDHDNVSLALNGGYFADRFRVQLDDKPATTVTSHIAKDGHYYIHPDPSQCRSLTVREAARLQTFPDNYFFCGGRTAQYAQVGNAVPPLLAREIARIVWQILK
jgi:DNA (cytosine-5)-methyltransferase 1